MSAWYACVILWENSYYLDFDPVTGDPLDDDEDWIVERYDVVWC